MRIHIVEDNADMLESLKMLLEMRGWEVHGYLRALDLLEKSGAVGADDVLVSDYYLPDMNGVELVKRVREGQPRVRVLLLTGSREDSVAASARALRGCRVLYKPLDVDALEEGIRKLKAA